MNATPTHSSVRPPRTVYLRALRKMHGLVLRLFTPRGRRLDIIEIGSGGFASRPDDNIEVRLRLEGTAVTSWQIRILREHTRDV